MWLDVPLHVKHSVSHRTLYTYSAGEGCSIALCEDHPGTQCGRMGSLIFPPLSFCFFQWEEKAFFISIKPPW